MGYRFCDNPPKPEDHLKKFSVRNGATLRIAYACYYMHGHNPKLHDHIGWPNPDHLDSICQETSNFRLYRMKEKTIEFEKIHLLDEGYNEVAVVFDDEDKSQYLDVNAWIDEDDDNIIRMNINTSFPTFTDKPIDLRFTIFVKNPESMVTDAIHHGMVTVLPGSPYPL